jgi:C-terminal processing protease CtpA/Prc
MNFANYDSGNITPNGQSVTLSKSVISENPVYLTTVINSGTHKIGYLIYNGFYPNYESQLNAAFNNLKSQNISDLVLDLRYNSGGSVATATRLASLITGQFTNQVFAKEQWNDKLEDYFIASNPSALLNLFTNKLGNNETLASLNLNKVYVLTTKSSASASELVINGLKPYINVVQIGDVTSGKNVGSITIYDSPSFSKSEINTNHRYAMQPIVLKIVNKVGFGDYTNGLQPNTLLKEDFGNLGILGNADEPLLNEAIDQIITGGRPSPQKRIRSFESFKDNRTIARLKSEMYVDEKDKK